MQGLQGVTPVLKSSHIALYRLERMLTLTCTRLQYPARGPLGPQLCLVGTPADLFQRLGEGALKNGGIPKKQASPSVYINRMILLV